MLIRDCQNAPRSPLMLVELRSQHADKCLIAEHMRGAAPVEITMPRLSDRDIDLVIDSLDRENRLGRLKAMSRDQRRYAFREGADRELLVAMYEATTGLKFRDRIIDEFRDLHAPANLIYAIAAVAGSRRFDLSRDEILLAVGDSSNETLNEIDRLIRRGLLIQARSAPERITIRHRQVGELLLDGVKEMGFMQRVVAGLLTAGAAKAHVDLPRSAKPFRLIRTFLNHEFLHEVLDVQQGRNVYADCEALLHWDHHLWLHRGAFEVEWGDLGLAENFLAQAKALMPGDAFIRNEWGYLLFKKAIRNAGKIESARWAAEASEILVALTYDDIPRPHPYHILGSCGLTWGTKSISDDAERAKYLRELQGHVARGMKLFPGNMQIRRAHSELEEAYLRIAVRRDR
jgi:hypothetical protein